MIFINFLGYTHLNLTNLLINLLHLSWLNLGFFLCEGKWWPFNKVVIMYMFSKKVSLSNLTWKLSWAKPTFYKVRRSCKQLNEVCRSGKALHKVSKICEQLYKLRKFVNDFMKFLEFANNFTKFVRLAKKLLWSL